MTSKTFSVYKDIPITYQIKKPRYWYKKEKVTPSTNGEVVNTTIEPFEGVNVTLDDFGIVKINKTRLWNGYTMKTSEYVFAPTDKTYIAVSKDWTTMKNFLPGCGKVTDTDTSVLLYRNKDSGDLIIGNKEDDVDEKENDWFGSATVPTDFNPTYLKKNYSGDEKSTYILDAPNKYVNTVLASNTYLKFNKDELNIFTDIPSDGTIPYTYRFTAKLSTYSSIESKSRVLGRFGFPEWIGLLSQKFAMYNYISLDFVPSANTTYWLRIEESYDGNGNYTHTIRSIVSQGYTHATLPANSSWTSKSITNTTPWLTKDSKLQHIGEPNGYEWNSYINLSEMRFEKSINGSEFETFWQPLEEVYYD